MSTHRQAQLLAFIRLYMADHDGASPSHDEMAAAMGFKAKSGVTRLIDGLEAAGLIRRHPGRARSIEIVEKNGTVDALKSALARYDASLARREQGDVAASRFVSVAREILSGSV